MLCNFLDFVSGVFVGLQKRRLCIVCNFMFVIGCLGLALYVFVGGNSCKIAKEGFVLSAIEFVCSMALLLDFMISVNR